MFYLSLWELKPMQNTWNHPHNPSYHPDQQDTWYLKYASVLVICENTSKSARLSVWTVNKVIGNMSPLAKLLNPSIHPLHTPKLCLYPSPLHISVAEIDRCLVNPQQCADLFDPEAHRSVNGHFVGVSVWFSNVREPKRKPKWMSTGSNLE